MSDDSVVLQEQPVSQVQLEQLKVEWILYDDVSPNDYNPNRMTLKDRLLLRQSLLEDGWTQSIVTLSNGEQRWPTLME